MRYGNVGEAHAAISTLDGTSVLGHTLQVKFADADAGEEKARSSPGGCGGLGGTAHGMKSHELQLQCQQQISLYIETATGAPLEAVCQRVNDSI